MITPQYAENIIVGIKHKNKFGWYILNKFLCLLNLNKLNSQDFKRVRVGIGKPLYKNDMINYVIGKVDDEELEILDKGTEKAKEAVIEIIKNGIDNAMNKFN